MADEFDIMKPISSELDIGQTMFDKPSDRSAASATQGQSAAPPPKPYTPPKDDGVYHAQYGYLTEEEAAVLDDSLPPSLSDSDKISASDSVMTAAGASSDPRTTVITDFDEYSTPTGSAAAPPPSSASFGGQRLTVQPTKGNAASGFPKAVKIAMTVLGIFFLIQFIIPFVMFLFMNFINF